MLSMWDGPAKSKEEQMKMQAMKIYTCPMHPGETSNKPGKCSKCGMDMQKTDKATKSYSVLCTRK
jgi:hypothetical protein